MNMKTTKFLAVLAVLAMAFVALVPMSGADASATGDLSVEVGDYKFISQDTAPMTVSGNTITYTGYFNANEIAGSNTTVAANWGNTALTYYAAVSIYIKTDNQVKFVETNSAWKEAYPNGVNPEATYSYDNPGQCVTKAGQETRYCAADTFKDGDTIEILVPQDNSNVTITITKYNSATGTETSETYTLVFKDSASTRITLAGDSITPVSAKWNYDGTSTLLTFTDDIAKANLSFYTATDGVSYTVAAGKTVNLIANDPNGVISINGGTSTGHTIKSGTDGTAAYLNLKQLNPQGYGIYSKGKLTIGAQGTATAADIFIKSVGGSQGIVQGSAGQALVIKGADIEVTAGEKGLSVTSDFTTTGFNNIVLKIDETLNANKLGSDKVFGLKIGTSSFPTISISPTTTIVTDGMILGEPATTANTVSGMGGIIVVNGGYTQTDYSEAYGVAGIVNFAISSMEATLVNSVSEAATAGKYYLVDGAGSYGVTVKNTGGTTVQVTDSTTKTTEAEIITDIAGKVANCTNATITLAAADTITSIDISTVMANATIANLESLTLIAGNSVKTVTAAKDVSVTNTKLTFKGLTVSGNFTNGTDSAQLSSVTGIFGVSAGSVHIDGNVESGNVYIDGDADISGQLTGTLNLFKKTGATYAALKILDAFSIKAGILNINDVEVSVDTQIKLIDSGKVAFKTGATFATDVKIAHSNEDNTNAGTIASDVAFTKDLTISGTKVTLGSDITTSKALVLGATDVTSSYNITANGDLSISEGSTVAVSGTASAVKTVKVAGDATIAGTLSLTNTKLTLEGITEVIGAIHYADDKSVITNNGTMTVAKSAETSVDGDFTDNGATKEASNFVNNGILVIKGTVVDLTNNKTVRLYGQIGYIFGTSPTITTNGKLVNEGTIYVMDAAAEIYTSSTSGKGSIDTSAVSEEVTLSGILKTTTTFTKYQIVTFTADTTIKETTALTFEGNAIIPMGVTVTIENGSSMAISTAFGKLTNNGSLVIEGTFTVTAADVENNGTISADYSGNVATTAITLAAGTTFVNNGVVAIGEKSILSNATENFINSKTGSITVLGDLTGTTAASMAIKNSGAVTISSEVSSAITISNAATGASVTITQAKGNVEVNDSSFTSTATTFKNGANKVALTNTIAANTYGGIVITSTTYKYSTAITTATALSIAGTLSVNSTEAEITNIGLALTSGTYGIIGVTDSLTLTETNLSLTSATTELYVSGNMSVDNKCTTTNNGEITVDGTLYVAAIALTGNVNAAVYEIPANVTLGTPKVFVYTNVPDAVADAAEAEIKTVTVTGEVKIGTGFVLPAGMTLKIDGANVTIEENVEVEIYTDGVTPAVLNSTGAITVEGKLVIDDVTKSKKGAGTIASEVILKSGNTEVYTTLTWAMADVGTEEATLTLCGPTVVKTNTTIPENITIDTNNNDFTVQNAELTIDGGLFLNGGNYKVTGDNGKVIVNGAITKETKMTHDGIAYPDGLYYSTLDSALYVIGNIADAEEAALIADNNKLTYYGDLKVTSVDFDAEGTLVFDGKVEVKTMEIGSKAKVTFTKDVSIDLATVGVSTITFADDVHIDGTFVSPVGTISFADTYAVDESKITVATASDVTTMTLTGAIGNLLALEDYQVATLGDVIVKANLAELTVGLGTVTVGANVTIGFFEVYGDLVIDNGFKMKSVAGLVYGSLVAKEATDTKAKAIAEIAYLGIGITPAEDTSAAAVVSGQVDVDYALVAADAVAPESITAMPYATDVYVELAEFLTIYGTTAASVDSIFTYMPVDFDISDPNAKFVMWADEDGKEVTAPLIGYPTEIYAVFNYDVYTVTIVTDAGVKSVALNGVEMITAGGNTFMTLGYIPADTYKVTYTLKSGYSGTAVLSTETGTVLKDNTFAITPGTEDLSLVFQLAGIEPTPEPEPEPTPTPEEKSEWTVTTILLCVLVVLIAIMAVIVALRLNRN